MADARGDHVTIDLERMMNSTSLTVSTQRCIFKAPNILSRHNPKAYAPNAFSIGPYHYGKQHLQATQNIKLMYLRDLVSSVPSTDPRTKLRKLVVAINTNQVLQEARECYAEPFDHIPTNEFVKILVIDGCFLIELFRRNAYKDLQKDDDPVFKSSCMRQFLCHDLILLENQIPWRVLEILFGITRNPEDRNLPDLSRFVLFYCYNGSIPLSRVPSDVNTALQQLFSREHGSKHILDLLRNSMVLPSSITTQNHQTLTWQSLPSATRLREAGIKFKTSTSVFTLDVKFKDGVLEIPPILIQETTESLFRNLICLEQCLPSCLHRVTSYAKLLDNLINTTEDMEILCKSGIVDNWLNIDDATKLFNQLYHDTFVEQFFYANLTAEVNEYCQHRWPKYRTVLMRDYFKHPWALVSVIAAAILLLLTFVQTLFTIIK